MKTKHGKYLTDGRGYDLCGAFNAGKCSQQGYHCPKNQDRVHACDVCCSKDHNAKNCNQGGGGNNGGNGSDYSWQPAGKRAKKNGGWNGKKK